MGSVAHNLLRLFRGPEPAVAPAANLPPQRVQRRSTGMVEFSRLLKTDATLRVLDLGPTSPTNISRLTGMGHNIYSDDALHASFDSSLAVKTDAGVTLDAARFLAENFPHPEGHFDAVLAWDLADYLHESLVRPTVARLHQVTKPGGLLLAFFHTRDAGPDAPYYRYHLCGDDTLEMQQMPRSGLGPGFKLQRVFNNRNIENLFRDFASIKFFLARDNMREVLVVR